MRDRDESEEGDHVATMRRGMQAVRSALRRNMTRQNVANLWKSVASRREEKVSTEVVAAVEEDAEVVAEEEAKETEEEEAKVEEETLVENAETLVESFQELSSKIEHTESGELTIDTIADISAQVHKCANLIRQLRAGSHENQRTTNYLSTSTADSSKVIDRLTGILRAHAADIERAVRAINAIKGNSQSSSIELHTISKSEDRSEVFWFDAPQHDLAVLGILDQVNAAIEYVDNAMISQKQKLDSISKDLPDLSGPCTARLERVHSDPPLKRPSLGMQAALESSATEVGSGSAGSRLQAEVVDDAAKEAEAPSTSLPQPVPPALPKVLRKPFRSLRSQTLGAQANNTDPLRPPEGLDQERPPEEKKQQPDEPPEEKQEPDSLEQCNLEAAAVPLPPAQLPPAESVPSEPRGRRLERKVTAIVRDMDDLSCDEVALLDQLVGRKRSVEVAHKMSHTQSLGESSAGLSGQFRRKSKQPAQTPRRLPPLDLPSILGMERRPSTRQTVIRTTYF